MSDFNWKKRRPKYSLWFAAAKDLCSRKRGTIFYSAGIVAMVAAQGAQIDFSFPVITFALGAREAARGFAWLGDNPKYANTAFAGWAAFNFITFTSLLALLGMHRPALLGTPAFFQGLMAPGFSIGHVAFIMTANHFTPRDILNTYKEMFNYRDNEPPSGPLKEAKDKLEKMRDNLKAGVKGLLPKPPAPQAG